ncbi:MAG: 3-deoxy-manno-octulosonate cytidylyltransferase [Sphingomonadaceae bacterium]|nr:3-deoxy-manno-octulosonate cytidylyltransferase [Sphingomonadaceae bacterium]
MTWSGPALAEPSGAVQTIDRDLIVIPARYGSSRLPGKPLLQICGRSLLERVAAIAAQAAQVAGDCDVVVGTDDRRIADHAAALGIDVTMTDPALGSGTLRAHAAAMQAPSRPRSVVNLQGDAPFVPVDTVVQVVEALRTSGADVVTPVFQLDWKRLDRLRAHKQEAPFSGTTCIRAADGRALWFSKAVVPAMRVEAQLRTHPMSPVWQHIGLYGYTAQALSWFAEQSEPGTYEQLESLEQLRFLEHGRTIQTIAVHAPPQLMSGIDTAADLAMAEDAIARYGDPFPA